MTEKRHILVVEDDEVMGESLGRILRKAGFQVSLVSHFQPALTILESEAPVDLVLTDIVMPESINGVALSRMARLRRRDLKVIYLTGYDIPGVEKEALGPVLRKPVEENALLSEIERALSPK